MHAKLLSPVCVPETVETEEKTMNMTCWRDSIHRRSLSHSVQQHSESLEEPDDEIISSAFKLTRR